MSPTITGELRPAQLVCAPTTLTASEHLAASFSNNSTFGSRELFSIAARLAAISAGVAILAASTRAVIDANHLTGSDAALVAALALGVAAASIALPRTSRWTAVALVIAALAGEGFGLLSSAERIVERREASASVITGSNDVRTAAQSRLTKAEAARDAQRDMEIEAVAMPSCAKECRALLDRQATDIANEVSAARAAIDKAPATRSATPLADRLGVQPWALDLLAAALLSIGANGLAAVLIAIGSAPLPRPAQPPHMGAVHVAAEQSEHAAANMHLEAVNAALADPTGTTLAMLPAPVPNTNRAHARAPGKTANITASAKRGKQSPAQPKVLAVQAQIVDLAKARDGRVNGSVRGLAAIINASPTTVQTAIAALVAAGIIERTVDGITLASRAA